MKRSPDSHDLILRYPFLPSVVCGLEPVVYFILLSIILNYWPKVNRILIFLTQIYTVFLRRGSTPINTVFDLPRSLLMEVREGNEELVNSHWSIYA